MSQTKRLRPGFGSSRFFGFSSSGIELFVDVLGLLVRDKPHPLAVFIEDLDAYILRLTANLIIDNGACRWIFPGRV
jgi:hypothetical protein